MSDDLLLVDGLLDRGIASRVISWQRQYGRNNLPWQNTRDAYRIWLSEIMLQQTQVSTVVSYYNRFLLRFPDLNSLSNAPVDAVLNLWSGLGYYTRARNLHRCAQEIMEVYQGKFPSDPVLLSKLPGIGPSTASAIAVFAYGCRAAILDANVKRVFCRHAAVQTNLQDAKAIAILWEIARQSLPFCSIESYTQGLMDLGAMVCVRTKPVCSQCPIAEGCLALKRGLTGSLPLRKNVQLVPRREVTLLLIRCQGALLMQKRPDSGIWGGLFCFPEHTDEDSRPYSYELLYEASTTESSSKSYGIWVAFLEKLFKKIGLMECKVDLKKEPAALPILEHRFTHVLWLIQPILLDINISFQPVADASKNVDFYQRPLIFQDVSEERSLKDSSKSAWKWVHHEQTVGQAAALEEEHQFFLFKKMTDSLVGTSSANCLGMPKPIRYLFDRILLGGSQS